MKLNNKIQSVYWKVPIEKLATEINKPNEFWLALNAFKLWSRKQIDEKHNRKQMLKFITV